MLLINGKPVEYFLFSGGEIQVDVPLNIENAHLTWKPRDCEDIILLMLTVDALREADTCNIYLEILYFPYARQDRVCMPGQALSLRVICKMLDSLSLDSIRIYDVHNLENVRKFMFTEVHNYSYDYIFEKYNFFTRFDVAHYVLCAPDKGAKAKVQALSDHFNMGEILCFDKVRCPKTGAIQSIKRCEDGVDISVRDILVVDDICDGGRTFKELAEVLQTMTTGNLKLFVTHGIFSKQVEKLSHYYKHIFCHHVLNNDDDASNEVLTVLSEIKDAN